MPTLTPSSTTQGFFQTLPVVSPAYSQDSTTGSDDSLLASIISLYLPTPLPPTVSNSIGGFARKVVHSSTFEHVVEAESHLPTLHTFTTFGQETQTGPLRTSAGWKALKDIGTSNGVVAHGYSQAPDTTKDSARWNHRIHQFILMYLWSSSSALTSCPMAMTDGAAVLIARHLSTQSSSARAEVSKDDSNQRLVLEDAYGRLTSFDPKRAWTSGQWMTERSGGSDVSGTETIARQLTPNELANDCAAGRDKDSNGLPLGSWRIDGFKWFSSATDADMVVLLARTDKGISTFFAPMRRSVVSPDSRFHADELNPSPPTEMNGVYIQRLKSKLGTKALPTAELLIRGMRGYLIGQEGQGVREISSILNITRLHTAVGNVGYFGRGLAVSRAYTRVRRTKSGALADNPQHLKWMADETIQCLAAGHLAFFGVALLGLHESSLSQSHLQTTLASRLFPVTSNDQFVRLLTELLRLLTPVMKAQCCHVSINGLKACVESLGGLGYCENNEPDNWPGFYASSVSSPPGILNIARIFRDSVVGVIWEGTTSVLGDDIIRVLKHQDSGDQILETFTQWVHHILSLTGSTFPDESKALETRMQQFGHTIRTQNIEALKRSAREILKDIEEATCACLLMFDARVSVSTLPGVNLQDAENRKTLKHEVAKRYIHSKFVVESNSVKNGSPAPPADLGDQEDLERKIWMDKLIFLGQADAGPQPGERPSKGQMEKRSGKPRL